MILLSSDLHIVPRECFPINSYVIVGRYACEDNLFMFIVGVIELN